MFDLLIKGAQVIDGTGSNRFTGIGVVEDRILDIGNLNGATAAAIEAEGKVLSPGFVDVHTHLDAQIFGMKPFPITSSWCHYGYWRKLDYNRSVGR